VLGTTGGGVVVPERDPAALARAIAAAAADRGGTAALGHAARERALAVFATPVVAAGFVELVARVSST
jgi:glycosyltransferase involved in cell wall biosynthesis